MKHPVKRVHVLLDRKGKTLSHAYVEMPNEEVARASLRTAQNSVLGKGKRARGVTVTRSSQEELMKALFPSWQGPFDGCRPSLASLSNEQVVLALEHGLVTEAELKALLHLIRSPDVSVSFGRRRIKLTYRIFSPISSRFLHFHFTLSSACSPNSQRTPIVDFSGLARQET